MKIGRFHLPNAWLLLGPTVLFWTGYFMNAVVIAANGGQMPVLVPGGCPADGIGSWIHQCMTTHTHWKFLADWIVMRHPAGVASLGDFAENIGEATFWPALAAWVASVLKQD